MKNIILLPRIIDELKMLFLENNEKFTDIANVLQREFSPNNRGLLYREEGKQIKIWSKKIALICTQASEKNSLKVVAVKRVKDFQYHFILERGKILAGNWSFILSNEAYRLEKHNKSPGEHSLDFIEEDLRKNNKDSFSIEDGLDFEKYVAYWENHDILKKYQEEALFEKKADSVSEFSHFTIDFDNHLIKMHISGVNLKYSVDENVVITSKEVWNKQQQLGNTHLKTLRGFGLGRIKKYRKGERLIVIQSKPSIIERLIQKDDLKAGFFWIDDIGAKSKLNRESEALKRLFKGESANAQLKSFMPEIGMIKSPVVHSHVKTELLSDQFHQFKDKQKEAVLGALNTNDIYLIQGPPGTGKTTVISEIIQYLVNDNQKILLSSQTNLAVDNVLQRIGHKDNVRAIRIGSEEKFELDSIQYALEQRVENLQKEITTTLTNRPNHFKNVRTELEKTKSLFQAHEYMNNEIKKIINMKQNYTINNEAFSQLEHKITSLKDKLRVLSIEFQTKNKLLGENLTYLNHIKKIQDNSLNSLQKNKLSADLMNKIRLSEENINNLSIYKGLIDEIQAIVSEIKSLKEERVLSISEMEQIVEEMQQINSAISDLENQYNGLSEEMKTYLMKDIQNLNAAMNDLEMDLHEYKYKLSKIDEKMSGMNQKALDLRNLALEIKEMIEKSISRNSSIWEKHFGTSSISKEKFLTLWSDLDQFKKEFSSVISYVHLLNQLSEHEKIILIQNAMEKQEVSILELEQEKVKKQTIIKKFQEALMTYQQNKHVQMYLSYYNMPFENLSITQELKRTSSFISTYELNRKELELYEMSQDIQNEWNKKLQYYQENFEDIYINSSNLICATCLGIASTNNNHFLNTEFDYVILDEAARASSMELLIPLIRGKKIVLVGDHKQISPTLERDILVKLEKDNIVDSEEINNVYKKSLFGLMYEDAHPNLKTFLNKQFRMSPGISDAVSRYYYENKLLDGENVHDKNHSLENILPKAFYWIDTPNTDRFLEKRENTSFSNEGEVLAIESILNWLNNQLEVPKTVGIISPYKAQMHKLLECINTKKYKMLDIEINTVDAFQGREKNIVINSLVRNNHNGQIGHIREESRMNVALSRAQELSIFIGNINFINSNQSKVRKIDRMIKDLKNKNSVLHVKDFVKDGETVWS